MHNRCMKSRVFVSCGQQDKNERRLARAICELLEKRGFTTYLAIDVQTILEINERIIWELKNSDCYHLVNFRREKIGEIQGVEQFRGSLFANQELAVAYSLGFERLLIINQEGVKPEGLLRYIGINTETFSDNDDCLRVVNRALRRAGWRNDYSRRLRAGTLRFQNRAYNNLKGWFLYLDIHNHRPDIAALETTARLSGYARTGRPWRPSEVQSPLKATGRPGFSHTIFPGSHESFDLLCIGLDAANPAVQVPGVYLNSALDLSPRQPLPVGPGTWRFHFEFLAIEFPLLSVEVQVKVPRSLGQRPRARLLSQEIA